MIIHSGIHDYELTMAASPDFAAPLLTGEQTFCVADENVYRLYPDIFRNVPPERLLRITAIEENKSLETALSICERMTQFSARRNARLVSFGGGITQDVTGFAANVLYRGIHWTFVPTTLLAACDSCIGGKTSLNYKGYKNLLGTFYPPERIYVCPQFFETLRSGDYLSGLGEVVKFNLLQGEEGLSAIEQSLPRLLARDAKTVARFTESSLLFKKQYIEADEYDAGVRVHLNFAHTFGHALESVSHYVIPHGTAVAMGTIVANRISVMRGLLAPDAATRMERVLRTIIPQRTIPLSADINALVSAIHNDKKQVDHRITAVLLRDGAKLLLVHDVTLPELQDAYAYLAEKGVKGSPATGAAAPLSH